MFETLIRNIYCRYINTFFENIDINRMILENIDTDQAILENIVINTDKDNPENIGINKDILKNININKVGQEGGSQSFGETPKKQFFMPPLTLCVFCSCSL